MWGVLYCKIYAGNVSKEIEGELLKRSPSIIVIKDFYEYNIYL